VIFDPEGVYEHKSVDHQSLAAPIAFDNIGKTLMLSMKSSVSQKVSLVKVLQMKEGSFKIPLVCPKGNYNNLKIDVSQSVGLTYLTAKPALKIINYCPDPIQYSLHYNDSEDSNIIFRNKPVEIYRFDPYSDNSVLELTLYDVFTGSVNLSKLLSKKESTSIKLVSCEAKTGMKGKEEDEDPDRKIYIELFSDTSNSALVIYSKINVFNETGLPLNFYSFKSSGMSRPRKALENGNRSTVFIASRAHDTVIVKPTLKTFEGMFDSSPKMLEKTVFPRKLNCSLNQKLRVGDGRSQAELNVVVVPNVVEVAPGILTKTITIMPKYVFVNSTVYNLCLIQLQSNLITKVAPQGREALIWKSEEKKCAFQVENETLNL
jgi:hypothetical protein